MPVTWDPQAQQVADPDTTLLADLTDLASIHAQGGLLGATDSTLSQETVEGLFEWGTGKFGPSLRALTGGMLLSYPVDGLIDGDGFTIEGWFRHPSAAWNSVSNQTLIAIRGLTYYIYLRLNGGTMTLSAERYGSAPSGTAGKQSGSVTGSISAGLVSGTWYPVAITYNGTHLKAFLNGTQVGANLAYTAPDQFTDDCRAVGIQIGGHSGTASAFAYSDIRVSITARIPATPVDLRSLDGTLTIDAAQVDRALDRDMLGVLHTPRVTGFDADRVSAATRIMRTAKMMNTTPMKAGAPDATRPTLGHSGEYSYDWQVVDRNLDEIARLGNRPYISLGDTPSIIGGLNGPFTGTDLTTRLPEGAPNNKQEPTDYDAYETIVGDFVHYIVTVRGEDVFAWSALNEPETTGFWLGTAAEFYDLHARTTRAIREHDPSTPIAGPETASGEAGAWSFTTAMMDANIAAGVDMELLAYHDYSGDINVFDQYVAAMNKYAADRSLPSPVDVLVGEHNWSSRHMYDPPPTNGYFGQFFLHVMAFGAAYTVAWLCNALKSPSLYGYAFSHLNAYTGDPRDGGFAVDQMLGNDEEQWAPYNAMKGMLMVLGDQRLDIDQTTLGPGVYGYAGHDTETGRIGIALASYGWANRTPRDISIDLTGLDGSYTIRRYLIDETHSSRWDTFEDDPAGAVDNELELMSETTVSDPTEVAVTLPRWSSTFITLDPGEAPGGISQLVDLGNGPVLLPSAP